MKVANHIRAFEQLLGNYDGKMPLSRFLVNYFKQNKQMGSSDRKWASRYIYCFFRLGNALKQEEKITRLAVADFMCHCSPSLVLSACLPELEPYVTLSVDEKLDKIKSLFSSFKLDDIFPFTNELSKGIDKNAFLKSFFAQPDLFISVNNTDIQTVINQLNEAKIIYKKIDDTTLALPNGTKLEQVINQAKLYQVQDWSSQKTGNFFKPNKHDYWWDCCAASGGKSILLHQLVSDIELLVSDVRETSLHNLQKRFQSAGIKKYQKKVLDLTQNNESILHHYKFDGILADLPCSGSGTWGRTPEMLHYFKSCKISNYAKLQKTITANAIKYLKPGKPLIYITCSVFKAENEDAVTFLIENFDLELEAMQLINGYLDKADSMFAARLIKKN